MHFSTLLSAAAFVPLTLAGYVLKDDYMTDFYGSFDFFTETDPTHGNFVKLQGYESGRLITARVRQICRPGHSAIYEFDQRIDHSAGAMGC